MEPRVFVSFSSGDAPLSARLLSRLRSQPVQVWDYSKHDEKIPGGEDMLRYLETRIDAADVFIPVVSQNAFQSRYTRHEVAHALQRQAAGAALRIIPLAVIRCDWPAGFGPDPNLARLPEAWPGSYEALQDLRFFRTRLAFFAEQERAVVLNSRNENERRGLLAQFNAQERESLEFALQDICTALDVRFVPAYIGDTRLPLHQRFEDELEDARQFHQTEKARDTFARLMAARTQLGLWLDDGSLNRALDAIQYFNAICQYELPGHAFYYPQIVQAVCLLNLGLLNEAEEVLLPLLKHPRKDESLYSALGVICFHRRDHAQACHWYSKALAAARERGEADPAASHGLLANALRCDFQVDVEAILQELAHTEIAVPADRIKVQALQAAVHVRQGHLPEALHIYQSMGPGLPDQPETLIDYADLLALPEVNRKLEGLRLLEESETKHGHIGPFRDRLALWNYELERLDAAERHAQRLMADFPLHRRYHMHAAQILHRRQAPLARRIAREVLSPKFGLPATTDDFFYCGMANWYLENLDRAEFDFERSGRPDKAHYRNLS